MSLNGCACGENEENLLMNYKKYKETMNERESKGGTRGMRTEVSGGDDEPTSLLSSKQVGNVGHVLEFGSWFSRYDVIYVIYVIYGRFVLHSFIQCNNYCSMDCVYKQMDKANRHNKK